MERNPFSTIAWRDGEVIMLDQRRLPMEEVYNTYRRAPEIAEAIRQMVIRGAPAIGCAAAMAVALEAERRAQEGRAAVEAALREAAALLSQTRPTAVNLAWALARMRALPAKLEDLDGVELASALRDEALKILDEDREANMRLGAFGAELLPEKASVLTHCNTGSLATGGYGTALGIIRAAVERGKQLRVFANETRPWFQGARLTAWELARDGIDVTVITDSQAGALMRLGQVDVAIVGADRIAANGDVANKIGTYTVAVLCHRTGLPFYVAAPTSTIDLETASGEQIPIEERPSEEVTTIGTSRIVPEGVPVRNMAFDVTPAELITAIVTERGILRPPYGVSLAGLFQGEGEGQPRGAG